MLITLNHGNGGRETARLVQSLFLTHLGNVYNSAEDDAAVVELHGRAAFTTDSFVVEPLVFKGGDIGRLAVCGTVNDLLTAGAAPKYLSAGFIIAEGMDTALLEKIAVSMGEAAKEAGVWIVTGDTKVVEGKGGLLINTAGVGELFGDALRVKNIRSGDAILLTGTLGDHHACIISARLGIENQISSDVAPLNDIMDALRANGLTPRALRDITRGGLATCLHEMASACGLRAFINEERLPVSGEVQGLCDILGLDPLYMANEGKMLLVIPRENAARAAAVVRQARYGENAVLIGQFESADDLPDSPVKLIMNTKIGGKRILPPLTGESLPRIC